MKIRDSISKEEKESISPQQSDDTKKLFAYLLLTYKNAFLYPEGHSILTNSIKHLHEMLVTQINQYGDIRIEIEKDLVLCQGVEVHKGSSEEGTLPFTLFRDGIRWLEFTEGIELEETRETLSIIRRYSVLTKEPEGDIVTAFWEAHFNHVLYKADDFFSGQEADQTDSLSESETMTPSEETEAEDKPASLGSPAIDTTSSGGTAINPADFVLTPQEQVELQEMISREENASAIEHLNMLLDMILQVQEEKDFNIIMEVLSEEFDGFFIRHDFEGAIIILDGIRKILDSGRLRTPWAVPLTESLYKKISSDIKCLKPLEKIWSSLNAQQIETLSGIFRHLNTTAVPTLVHLLLLGQSSQLEKIADDTIISFARQDISCLEPLVNDSDERVVEKLVSVLFIIERDSSLKYLTKLARHSSVSVRRMAVKAIGQIQGYQTPAIFEFLDDKDVSVRLVILTQMGQSRNEIAEDLLTQYLKKRNFSSLNSEHIIECFKTLGKCGSSRSVPFLREALLHQKWLAGLKKSEYREGAAHALVALKTPEARQVIEEAGRSFYPGLRRLAREAGREYFQKDRGGQ